MDEGAGDEVAATGTMDAHHFQSREIEYSLKPGSSGMLEAHGMAIPSEGDDHEISTNFFADISDHKHLERINRSENACASPRGGDDSGLMVEELTLRNYDSKNLGIGSTSNDRVKNRHSHWQNLYQIAGGSGSGSSGGEAACRVKDPEMSSFWGDVGCTSFPDLLGQEPRSDSGDKIVEHKPVQNNTILPPGGIRTKMLSKSGFSKYFIKSTLKGKGVICRGPAHEVTGVEIGSQTYGKTTSVANVDSDVQLRSSSEPDVSPSQHMAEPCPGNFPSDSQDGLTLREWLKAGQNSEGNRVQSLHIFKQIVSLVDFFHTQGVALQALRPSCFKLLPSSQVIYTGSSIRPKIIDNFLDQDNDHSDSNRVEKRPLQQAIFPVAIPGTKKWKPFENTNFARQQSHFPIRYGIKSINASDAAANTSGVQDTRNATNDDKTGERDYNTPGKYRSPFVSSTSMLLSTTIRDPMEENWYMCPEEIGGRSYTFSSNIYCLGVLLFELLGSFDSERAHTVAMKDLRHRILPPNFLSKNPKEAGFCLWLLHPEPSSRPTTREILLSELIKGIQEVSEVELSISIDEADVEADLLLHFLASLKEQKHKDAAKIAGEIRCLEADIEEVGRRKPKNSLSLSCLHEEALSTRGFTSIHRELSVTEMNSKLNSVPDKESRLMKNISQLESAYFYMRSNVQFSGNDTKLRADKELLTNREKFYQVENDEEKNQSTNPIGVFFDGLCKYARYSKFEVRGMLRNGDLSNSANVICSLSFDRGEDYFAAAGISKKIKIYEFDALFNNSVDVHYPVIELSNKSNLSCVCWNSYIRNYIASTDYDGMVKLWDAGTGQVFSQYTEHDKRAWSVDFCRVDPTKLASGSDDCTVKLWSINEKKSLCTVRNIANICCVQFSAVSTNLLAFGSADYKTYCYDLRNVKHPWCVLAGHDKAVSFVKFLDSETVVSASTDNTLKLWDLNKTSSNSLSTNACTLTLRGHTNEKNFVGLSVSDGYIACGSESNEVFAYYRTLPMPITHHKFGSIDPISGRETDDDNGQFVSSVCWRRKSDMVIAANSSGCIKLLQMV